MTAPVQIDATAIRPCACGGTYQDDRRAKGWRDHSKTRQHKDHEARFEVAGEVPVNEPACFRGYPGEWYVGEGPS